MSEQLFSKGKTGGSPTQPPARQQARQTSNEELPHEPAVVSIEALKPNDVVIAVMGPTGCGKSAFINSASGHNFQEVGHALQSFTTHVRAIRFWDQESMRHIVLVDTPGFDNTSKSDRDILSMIAEWLNESYKKNILLSGILYLHRITDRCMADATLKNFKVFHQLCGKDALARAYLTTTMWDEVDPEVGETRLEELRTDFWNTMIDHGAQIARCRTDDGSPKELVRRILYQESPLKALLIQQEMVQHNKELKATSAGLQQLGVSRTGSLQRSHATKEPPEMMKTENLQSNDVVIAVFGLTGSGKSTHPQFVCSASERNTTGVGHTLKSFTSKVHTVRFQDRESGRHVVLVDTPGFDSTFTSDRDTLKMIAEWLGSSYKNKHLSGILYLHRITDNRMAGSLLENLQVFRQLCGKDALEKVFLTTTMWDEVDEEVGERRLEELSAEYWKPMLQHGAKIARCRHDDDSPRKLIQDIMFQEDERQVLLLQQEIGKENKEPRETATGKQLYSQLEKLVEKQSELLRRIAKERMAASNPNTLTELHAEYNELRAQVDDKLRQMQELKLPWFKKHFRLFSTRQ